MSYISASYGLKNVKPSSESLFLKSIHIYITALVSSYGDFVTLCWTHRCLCFRYSQQVSSCEVPLQQIAGLFFTLLRVLSLPPLLHDLVSACADERWVDTLVSDVCVWGLEKPWELHLLCKCKPLIDCRARSLSFSGWTLPSAGSRGSCQGNVCPLTHTHTPHTFTHALDSLPFSVFLCWSTPGMGPKWRWAGCSLFSLWWGLVMKKYSAPLWHAFW